MAVNVIFILKQVGALPLKWIRKRDGNLGEIFTFISCWLRYMKCHSYYLTKVKYGSRIIKLKSIQIVH